MGDGKYRLVTDPSEGPKLFQIDTRVTSRGEVRHPAEPSLNPLSPP